ncbi:outer-membrane lipoprotein carrier protein LolA [Methylocystis sp. SC2]|uniref:outer-membrane lipoprotein carrier protein LolA n=1 Tax=Methylocystis sp. (strain SC2) TaxID=187303 RepID=UPI00027AEBFC|nr:outer-membrane lipoprotein carrier protein LolA [Methylocystis sp. SC2]CCJ08675.1 Outer membrane lipoprotein carrier protein LolA [Methylocystis sp. SC2]
MTYVRFAALLAALSFAVPAAAATIARAAPPSQGSVSAGAENKAAEAKPAGANPTEARPKSAEVKAEDEKSVDPKPVTVKPAPAKPGEAKPADPIGKKSAKPTAQGPASAAATIAPAPAPEPEKPLTRAEAVKRANAFFNASPVMTADFVQIGGDGKRSEGRLHVQRAGRVRFEYAQPATMEVVADGAQVAVRDRKLNTQDLYFITQTPLKFLMKDKIDLEKDVTVEDVKIDDSGVTIAIEDKATFGGTSHVRLIFDPKTFKLKQWQVKDPQGYETLISVFNIDQAKVPDPTLFKINK